MPDTTLRSWWFLRNTLILLPDIAITHEFIIMSPNVRTSLSSEFSHVDSARRIMLLFLLDCVILLILSFIPRRQHRTLALTCGRDSAVLREDYNKYMCPDSSRVILCISRMWSDKFSWWIFIDF